MRTCLYATVALAIALAGAPSQVARAEPMWTTYHRDAQRSGDDPDGAQPIAPMLAWQTANLGAPIWSQPLVLGERVYVATVGDEVFALEASTGKVVWEKSVGTPAPASGLPCGDVEPTVGVVGTPAIDPATEAIYLVADKWDAQREEAHHVLEGLRLSDGEAVLSKPVDPPGADPKALLQRTALNLDGGNVIFGFGGNDGDCGEYRGTVVAAPESGGEPRFWQYRPAPPSSSGGAVWATGGPAVDGVGNVYASTGNPNPPPNEEATVFDYSDSVVKLNPSQDLVANPASEPASPLGWFEPPTWRTESNTDADLGSAAPELLPGGVLFQAGKSGTGYLLDESAMGNGAKAVFESEVCSGAGSFGGDAFAGGVIYMPCTNGVQALAYDGQARTFVPLWQGPSDAVGPPIVSGGLVWSVATGGFGGGGEKLYGLNPATGAPIYTETLPSPVVDHFASPSAAGGRLFVATGSTVTAYQIAQLSTGGAGGSGGSNTGAGNPPPGSAATSATTPQPASVRVELLGRRLRASASGRVRVALRCASKLLPCRGAIALFAHLTLPAAAGTHRRSHTTLVELARSRFGPERGDFGLTLHMGRAAMARLRRHQGRLAVQVRISPSGTHARGVTAVLTLSGR